MYPPTDTDVRDVRLYCEFHALWDGLQIAVTLWIIAPEDT